MTIFWIGVALGVIIWGLINWHDAKCYQQCKGCKYIDAISNRTPCHDCINGSQYEERQDNYD